jgi:oligopeptide transport system substrate-binding protein
MNGSNDMKTRLWTALLTSVALAASLSLAAAEMVYNRGANGDPQSLDPHKTSTVEEANIIRDLFSGLVVHDAKADIMPGAAESWTISPDGKVYTFKLRKDDVWSDGMPVTAKDFVFSFRRVVDPATASEYAYIIEPIVNAKEITAGTAKPETMGVKAIDDLTLEITLKSSTPYFLELLTHQAAYGISEANVTKFGADWVKPGNMISNGAFTLAEFTPNDKIKLVKNPKFFDAANVKLDVVNYLTAEDRSAAMKRFEAGELDSNNDFPTEQLTELKTKFGDQVRISPLLGTYYYIFKTKKDPWSNVKLRHALAMAIDRDYLAEKVWQNAMIPAYSMVPPGVAGYTPSMTDYVDKSQLDREDEAKKVFTELGISPEKPMNLELRFNTSDNHKNTAVAIQDMLKPFGFNVTLINTDGKTHYSFLEQKGNFDVARAGWNADYKDPATFLDLGKTGAGNNYGEYSNKEYDDLLSAASSEADAPKRMALLSQAEAIFMRDLPVMPLLYYSCHNIVSNKIKGFEENVMDIHPSRFISKE